MTNHEQPIGYTNILIAENAALREQLRLDAVVAESERAEIAVLRADLQRMRDENEQNADLALRLTDRLAGTQAALQRMTEERDDLQRQKDAWLRIRGTASYDHQSREDGLLLKMRSLEAALRDLLAQQWQVVEKAREFVEDVESCEDLQKSRDWDGHPNPFDLYIRETCEFFAALIDRSRQPAEAPKEQP